MLVNNRPIPKNSILYNRLLNLTDLERSNIVASLDACEIQRNLWLRDYRRQPDSTIYNPKLHKRAKVLVERVEALCPGYSAVKCYGYGLLANYHTQVSKKKLLQSPAELARAIEETSELSLTEFLQGWMSKLNLQFSLTQSGCMEARAKVLSIMTNINKIAIEFKFYGDNTEILNAMKREHNNTNRMTAPQFFSAVVNPWLINVVNNFSQTQLLFCALCMELTDDYLQAVTMPRIDVLPSGSQHLLHQMNRQDVIDAVASGQHFTQYFSLDRDLWVSLTH